MSRALQQFDSTSKRSAALLSLGHHLHSECINHKPTSEEKQAYTDMGRAGVVLAVAAMDAFFTRRFAELLVPFLKNRGPTEVLIDLLATAGLDTAEALSLIAMERPYRRVRSLASGHLARYTTQRFDAVDALFRAYGLKDLCAHAEKRAKRKQLLRSVEILVERRHGIVHSGDHNEHGKIIPLDFDEMKKRIQKMGLLVASTDTIISNLEKKLK